MDLNTQLKKIQLTQTQNAIWLESKLHEHKPLFIIGAYLLLSAKLNGELLKEAISNVVEKNDGLRIRIPNSNQPFQVFEEKVEFDIVEKRMESLVEARHWLEKFFKTNIKFEDGCLFEFALISIGDDKSYLSLKFHHLIMDGWARGVFFRK